MVARLSRLVRFAGVAARTTRDVIAARTKEKLGVADEGAVAEALRPTAERLVEVLGEMKGAATKLGQFVSLVDQEVFPEEARKALHRLLHQAPRRMAFDEVQQIVSGELGQPIEQAYASFDREPFAAASIGQVHGATTHDGRDVVVKVQFPGVGAAIEADLANLGTLGSALAIGGGVLDKREYLDEIALSLRRETDYTQEANQLQAYRKALEPWPDLVVPTLLTELTAQKVLTLERLRGPTMIEAAHDPDFAAADRFRIGGQLVAATWGPFLRQGLIHADPHPGNYVVLPEGRLGVLDFGATKQLSPRFAVAYWRLLEAAWHDEWPHLTSTLQNAGFRFDGEPERTERWLQGLARIVERPFRGDEYDWGACRIALDVRAHATGEVFTALRCRPPHESLMFYRAAAGAAGDLRLLRSKGSFRRVLQDVYETARRNLSDAMVAALADAEPRPVPLVKAVA